MSERQEGYEPGWADDAVAMMARRTATSRARFLLGFLKSGMRVLDVGCGPGTITLGLARTVTPDGIVVGVDVDESQVELARSTARRADVANVAFQVGSAYALPFGNASFDAALMHGLLEHLAHPLEALAEVRRVLRQDGVVGLCSSDWRGAVVEPRTPDVDTALSYHCALRRRAGGDPFAGGRLPALAEAAGFVECDTTTTSESDMSYGELARYVTSRIEAAQAKAGPVEREELAAGAAAARRWARHDDGGFKQRWVAVTARCPQKTD